MCLLQEDLSKAIVCIYSLLQKDLSKTFVYVYSLLQEDLNKTIAVHLSTAHPHFDSDGNMYNLGTYLGPRSYYNIIKIPAPADSGTALTSFRLNRASVFLPSASYTFLSPTPVFP